VRARPALAGSAVNEILDPEHPARRARCLSTAGLLARGSSPL